MNFIWDDTKAVANRRKHKVTFEEAQTVFYDPLAKITEDPDHSHFENRFILVGHSQKRRVLFVVHIYLEKDDTVRIISARKATKRERNDFESLE